MVTKLLSIMIFLSCMPYTYCKNTSNNENVERSSYLSEFLAVRQELEQVAKENAYDEIKTCRHIIQALRENGEKVSDSPQTQLKVCRAEIQYIDSMIAALEKGFSPTIAHMIASQAKQAAMK